MSPVRNMDYPHNDAENHFALGEDFIINRTRLQDMISYWSSKGCHPQVAAEGIILNAIAELYSMVAYLDKRLQLDVDYPREY